MNEIKEAFYKTRGWYPWSFLANEKHPRPDLSEGGKCHVCENVQYDLFHRNDTKQDIFLGVCNVCSDEVIFYADGAENRKMADLVQQVTKVDPSFRYWIMFEHSRKVYDTLAKDEHLRVIELINRFFLAREKIAKEFHDYDHLTSVKTIHKQLNNFLKYELKVDPNYADILKLMQPT